MAFMYAASHIRGPKTVAYLSYKHLPRRAHTLPSLIQVRVSDANAAGSKPTYPSEPVPNPVQVPAYQVELPSSLHMGIGEQVWR